MKRSVFVCFLLVICPCAAHALPEWKDAREAVSECYDGWDVTIELSAGISAQVVDPSKEDATVGLMLTVPLYSKEDRLAKKDKAEAKIKELSLLYAQFEEHTAMALALGEQVKVLKKIMLEGGQAAISAYFQILAQKSKSESLIKSTERSINSLVENCQ